ncbi:MAG: 2-oxo acid dehydrogenase subunit E2 [Myxococcales bacterium]
MANLELTPKKHLSSFRKIAIGTWTAAYDPSVYGTLEVPMDKAMKYLADFRARTGRRLTVSHMMAKVAAMALKEVPDANAVLRWNRIYLRKRIGIFFQVVMTDEGEGKADLSGATLYDLEQKSLLQICDEFHAKVETVRRREDPALEGTRKTFLAVPYFALNAVLRLISFLAFTLNLDLRWAGVGKDPFGSMMITNVGSLGLDTAYVPLVPFSRVPILLALGAVHEVPVARGGAVTVAQMMRVNATFDHRIIDGFHASVLSRVVRDWFEHPYERFDRLDQINATPAITAATAPG